MKIPQPVLKHSSLRGPVGGRGNPPPAKDRAISIITRNNQIASPRWPQRSFPKPARRATLSTPRGSGMRNSSGFGLGAALGRRRGRGSAFGRGGNPGNSNASARHNGRNIRPASGDAASSAAISGVCNAACNCDPNPAARYPPARTSQPKRRGRTAFLRRTAPTRAARCGTRHSRPARNRISIRSIRPASPAIQQYRTRVCAPSNPKPPSATSSPRKIVRRLAETVSGAMREGAASIRHQTSQPLA